MTHIVNAEQTETIDGVLKFLASTEEPRCDECFFLQEYTHGRVEDGLPCSPGTRTDGKSGIWVRA